MDSTILLIIAGMMGLSISLTFAVYRTLARPPAAEDFDDVLAKVTGGELAEFDTTLSGTKRKRSASLLGQWNTYWADAARKAGRVVADDSGPGRVAFLFGAVAGLFGVLVYPGGFGGILVPAVVLGAARMWLTMEQGKRKSTLEKQMPLLLSGLRTQMHAGVTVQGALMAVTDDLPSPIRDELASVRQDVAVGVPLDKALTDLAERMDSRLMQFLVSSIGVAIRSGSDLVPQLITIEEIVRQRARIQGKIRSALALAKPTAYLAIAAPVMMFLWLCFADPNYLSYWFGPGLLMLAGTLVWFGIGIGVIIFMVRRVERT